MRGRTPRAAGPAASAVLAAALGACSPQIDEYEQRGDRYSARGEYVDAQVEYQLALDRADAEASVDLRLKAAELALRAKDFTEANRLFAELLEREGEYEREVSSLYYLHARRWAAAGDTFAALRAVEWLQERDSTANLGSLYYTVGDAAYARPDYDQAIAAYLLGLARVPEEASPLVYFRLGEAFERRRNCAPAVEYFQRYLTEAGEDAPEAGDVRYRLGSCAFRLAERAFSGGDFTGARRYIDLVVRLGEPVGRLAEADLMMARIHERMGDRERAMEYYRRVLERREDMSSSTSTEAYRRLKQLEFGLPLDTLERLERAAGDSLRRGREEL